MSEQSTDLSTGVYALVNRVNGKLYVGSAAISFVSRENDHKTRLRRGRHSNGHLQAAWNKYGEVSFKFVILERCSAENCIVREQYWIDLKKSSEDEFGYNLSPTAGSVLGIRRSEETRAKISAKLKGKVFSVETRTKLSIANKGKSLSAETCAKMSEARLGRPLTPQHRMNVSLSQRGRKFTDAHKIKLSLGQRRRKPDSLETRRRKSIARLGWTYSQSTKNKLAAAAKAQHARAKALKGDTRNV